MTQQIKNGDIVKWAEPQNEAERSQTFVVCEAGDDGKCYIKPANWDCKRDGIVVPAMMTKIDYLELS